ncbi:hypothetical protein [Streptomyces humidus]
MPTTAAGQSRPSWDGSAEDGAAPADVESGRTGPEVPDHETSPGLEADD